MVHSEDIGRELRGISKVVAEVSAVYPLAVPEGFFEHFPEKALALVRHLDGEMGEEAVPMLPTGLKDRHPFEAPPPGYFEGFADKMLRLIREEETETPHTLEHLRDQPTYRIPEGYFDGLPQRMLALAKAAAPANVDEELQELSPWLASLPRTYPGTVPAGYFEQFSPASQIAAAMTAKVVPLSVRTLSVRQFLAAAVTVGVILMSAVWGYHIYQRPNDMASGIALKTPAQFNNALAKISDQAIVDYLKSNADVADADLIASEADDLPNGIPGDNVKVDDNNSKASE
ncbi:hypothetical protein [Dinghuibacter silviterrae]|uniref:Uncharacterized protein n=1 Tax=Dinghuibacter silviterrae TaxID=1539049 RepID=A0A4R8DQC0_9BACT|nr:hypothetical protein [Dinghuibacter silviterrae]TDX00119.1 hypothetical protein EDB95_1136 [Dinghuibacter silviterrae]